MMDMGALASQEFLTIIQWHEASLTIITIEQLSVLSVIIVCEAIESNVLMSCS